MSAFAQEVAARQQAWEAREAARLARNDQDARERVEERETRERKMREAEDAAHAEWLATRDRLRQLVDDAQGLASDGEMTTKALAGDLEGAVAAAARMVAGERVLGVLERKLTAHLTSDGRP